MFGGHWLSLRPDARARARQVGARRSATSRRRSTSSTRHFPRQETMPGVLILGTIGKVAKALLEHDGGVWRLHGRGAVQFRTWVSPGDQMEITVTLKSRDDDEAILTAEVKVDGKLVTRARKLRMVPRVTRVVVTGVGLAHLARHGHRGDLGRPGRAAAPASGRSRPSTPRRCCANAGGRGARPRAEGLRPPQDAALDDPQRRARAGRRDAGAAARGRRGGRRRRAHRAVRRVLARRSRTRCTSSRRRWSRATTTARWTSGASASRPRRAFYPLFYVEGLQAAALFYVSQAHGLKGSNVYFAGTAEAGAEAIGRAYRAVKRGEVDMAVAGGYDDGSSWWNMTKFEALGILSPDGCRPYDTARNGTVLGEGAAFLVLESEESAKARGATILAEIAGFGGAYDTHALISLNPEGRAPRLAMQAALREAGADERRPRGRPRQRDPHRRPQRGARDQRDRHARRDGGQGRDRAPGRRGRRAERVRGGAGGRARRDPAHGRLRRPRPGDRPRRRDRDRASSPSARRSRSPAVSKDRTWRSSSGV